MGYWLLDHPNPFYKQYRADRRTRLVSGLPAHNGQLTGGIILHDAEGGTDLIGPDMTAENVASFIDSRTNAGSYHRISDRDSRIKMAPFEYEVWHDTTSNPYTIGICIAWNVADLKRMTRAQREEYYKNFAADVLEAIAYLKTKGITVPLDRYRTRAEIMAGHAGISTHSRMDPGRRSDPFETGSVYEGEFLNYLRKAAGSTPSTAAKPATILEVIKGMKVYKWFFTDKAATQHGLVNRLEGWWMKVPGDKVDGINLHLERDGIPVEWHTSSDPNNKYPRYVADPETLAPRGEVPFNDSL
jgi:hypothetical protein